MEEESGELFNRMGSGVEPMVPEGMVEFAELMIKDDESIPKPIRKKWWGFFGKDTILTRSNRDDEYERANNFAIMKNHQLMSRPYYANTPLVVTDSENIRERFMAQGKRSREGFERQALMTQIREFRDTRPLPESKGNFLGSLKKKLGFGPKPEQQAPNIAQ